MRAVFGFDGELSMAFGSMLDVTQCRLFPVQKSRLCTQECMAPTVTCEVSGFDLGWVARLFFLLVSLDDDISYVWLDTAQGGLESRVRCRFLS